ncbi:hypothetical protein [uncultured Mucilaginibacter sp.]|uniref:hypothetical protein n=1 Tax=uncultured Mucilaginibacter sp. TaxID=797541 RepID=UPI00262E4541|nr:hypothetical protein [uncultured Mucilaginibacter sp.]
MGGKYIKPLLFAFITPEAMQLRIKLLEEALENKKLENLALSKMIDITGRELKISIRKNFGAKQSKK